MDIQEIINRNYKGTTKRGLITRSTSILQFVDKIEEEQIELMKSIDWQNDKGKGSKDLFDASELADIILVCLAMSKHYDIAILKELEKKMLFNESRPD